MAAHARKSWGQVKGVQMIRWVTYVWTSLNFKKIFYYRAAIFNQCAVRVFKTFNTCPDWCGSVGWVLLSRLKGHRFLSPIRAHAWVVGSAPGWGAYGRRRINVYLAHGYFLPSLPPFSSFLKKKSSKKKKHKS